MQKAAMLDMDLAISVYNDAGKDTASVTSTLLQVSSAAEESGHTAHDVLDAASEVSRQAKTVSGKVGNFLEEVRRG